MLSIDRAQFRTATRAALIGLATGGRATSGVTALTLTSRRTDSTAAKAGALVLAGGELVVDKLPGTPSRLEAGGMVARTVLGLTSGAVIARRRGESVTLPALVGLVGAVGGALLGAWWRRSGAPKAGVPALAAALLEDSAVAAAATLAVARI